MTENEFEFGNCNVVCDKNILISIISLATKEINGVSCLVDTFALKFKRLFKRTSTKGVIIDYNKNGKIVVDVYLRVFNNVKIPEISFKIQENIKNNISSMAEMSTSKINVHIVGVDFITTSNKTGE